MIGFLALVPLSAAGCGGNVALETDNTGAGGTGGSAATGGNGGSAATGGNGGSAATGGAGGNTTTSPDCSSMPFQYSVLAGNGAQGFGGDHGPATQAQLGQYLSGMAKDAAGNLYIADAGNARIRKVDPSGVITTYAGNGTSGYAGDGGPAIEAELNGPAGVAVDSEGNLYFAEFNNPDIRKVDTQGVISTHAHLGSMPTGLAMDASDNLYVAMFALETIVEVTPGGDMITVAGTGWQGYSGDGGPAIEAALANPNGIWVDAQGSLFINDSDNHVVRKVDSTGTISTIAGTGVKGYSGDEGPATAARIDSAYGVAVDAAGEIFLADTGNNVIRMIDACGVIHTVAGNGSTSFASQPGPALGVGFAGPGYSWLDEAGAMYFSDTNAGVYRISR